MATPLSVMPWDECLLAPVKDRNIESWLRTEAGTAPEWTRYVLSSPWFARLAVHLDYDDRKVAALDNDLAMRVLLVVSQENSCRYCYAMVRMMLRLHGLNETRMRELESRLLLVRELPPDVAAAVRFARILNRGNPLDSAAEYQTLIRSGFRDEQILQLVWLILCMGVMNRLITTIAPAPAFLESASSHWALDIVRPLAGWVMARLPRARLMKEPEEAVLPFLQPLQKRYAGTLVEPVVRLALKGLWEESPLSIREKLLIFATVTEGIDCDPCRVEVNRLAAEAGIDPVDLKLMVSHLEKSGLSLRERLMLEYARESLWYEPQRLQRRAKAVHAQTGRTDLVEMLAVVALANMLVRMSAILGTDST
jgi:AhpD family alkylhydroperoxidase